MVIKFSRHLVRTAPPLITRGDKTFGNREKQCA